MKTTAAPETTAAPTTVPCLYVNAVHEWKDPDGFGILLDRSDGEESDWMQTGPSVDDGTVDSRLYRAAFFRCAKDIASTHIEAGPLLFAKEGAAKRVAAAVNKELAAIAKGKPGPTDADIRFRVQTLPRK